jgi:hypothetical protein
VARWSELVEAEPEFAERVRAFFDRGVHKTIATLRRDGSPRISGIEARFGDGELFFGGMWRSRKALDLRRDPRFALHSASIDPPDWDGDAKLSGFVEEVEDEARKRALVGEGGGEAPSGPFHLFAARIEDAVVVRLNEARDRLLIDHWKPGEGVRTTERD